MQTLQATGTGSLTAHRDSTVLTLQLSNAGRANALDLAMLSALEAHIDAVEADTSIRVVVLRGTPGGTFSSGADVRQWGPMSPDAFARDWIARGNTVFRRFEALRCPTVAAIEGICFGGGLELALCADLRVATSNARFRFPEADIGAIPGWEGGPRLARVVGRGRALEAVLTTMEIDAARALDWGLVNRCCSAEAFEQELTALVQRLASVSPCAAALAKAAILREGDSAAFHQQAAAAVKASPDAQTGLNAFASKTTAIF
jgi:enoyl-CoA hydratase/carnithine racemase